MKKRYYVAYGSNLNIEQMGYRCPGARIIGISMLMDYELLFKGSKTGAYLTIEPREGSMVPVAVWEVTAKDEESLDRYEGCPSFYYKKEIPLAVYDIETGKPSVRRCFIYIMHEDRRPGIPTYGYVDTCLEGYDSFGFDRRYLEDAISKSWEVMQDERRANC